MKQEKHAADPWPEDVAAIYAKIAEEDLALAAAMFAAVKKTWPAFADSLTKGMDRAERHAMATVESRLMTADEFCEWASRPENASRRLELERGEPIEMPPPGELHGAICFLVAHLLGTYIFRRGQGYVCVNDTGLLVERDPDTLRSPDLMLFDEKRRLDQLSLKYATAIPKLVVEVFSPSDSWGKTIRRVGQYLRRGVPLVWVVDPESRSVSIHRSGRDAMSVDEPEELTGEDVLPDLRCRVADFFTLPGEPA